MEFAFLVLMLGGAIWGTEAQAGCGRCQIASCPAVQCRVPELVAKDECGCCSRCLGVQGERCGGRALRHGRCAPGYVCLTSADGQRHEGEKEKEEEEKEEEGTGTCVCKHDYPVCGSDANTYPTICALHLASWISVHQLEGKIHKTHDGECKYGPVIVLSPKSVQNVTGAQVYLVCEVKAVPTPIITWRKVTESPKGVKLLEELPGDRVNVAVQVRGGPSKHESTGWVLINPLTKEDEGVYQCHASNILGEAQTEATINVTKKAIMIKGKKEKDLQKEEAGKKEKDLQKEEAGKKEKDLQKEEAGKKEKDLQKEEAGKKEKDLQKEEAGKKEKDLQKEEAGKKEKDIQHEEAGKKEKDLQKEEGKKEKVLQKEEEGKKEKDLQKEDN